MPTGDDAFERKRQQMAARKAAFGDGPKTNDFKLRGGQFAHVRPLEQGDELSFADNHRLPFFARSGKRYFRTFLCRNLHGDGTPCPMCQHPNPEISRTATLGFINVIWRQAPIFERDSDGKMVKQGDGYVIIGREDQIALWTPSWTVFEMVKEKDRKYQGVMSRDWEVARTGSGADDTKYFIEPAVPDGGPQPMTIADTVLAAKKYDLSRTSALMTPLEYDAVVELLNRGSQQPQQLDRSQLVGQQSTAAEAFQPGASPSPSVHSSAFTRG